MSVMRTIRKLKSWLENKDVKIGWYSEKQRNAVWTRMDCNDREKSPCANVYLTPEGKEILITEVTDGLTTSSKWDDMKMMGPVTKHMRCIYGMHTHFN